MEGLSIEETKYGKRENRYRGKGITKNKEECTKLFHLIYLVLPMELQLQHIFANQREEEEAKMLYHRENVMNT